MYLKIYIVENEENQTKKQVEVAFSWRVQPLSPASGRWQLPAGRCAEVEETCGPRQALACASVSLWLSHGLKILGISFQHKFISSKN